MPLASTLDADRTIGTLVSGLTLVASNRNTAVDLAGYTLAVSTTLGSISSNGYTRNTFICSNGTVQIGSAAKAANLTVGASATLRFAPGTTLNATNLGALTVGVSGYIPSYLDMRGVTVTGGALDMGALTIQAGSHRAGQIFLNDGTGLNRFHVRGATSLCAGLGNSSYLAYIGDPGNTFNFEGQNYGYFPAGADLFFGVSPSSRGSLVVGRNTAYRCYAALRAASGGGGRFTAYLSLLEVAGRTYNGTTLTTARCLLDVSAMDGCLFDVQTLSIAPGFGALTQAGDDDRGVLSLPPGTGTVANATLGAPAGLGYGKLILSNTLVTVTGSLTLNTTARAAIAVGTGSDALDINGTFSDAGGSLAAAFLDTPPVGGLIWALRVAGDVRGTLQSMIDDGRLTATPAAPTGFHIGLIYDEDEDVTLFALGDEDLFIRAIIVQARSEATFEKAAGLDVVVGVGDIDQGSYDPEGDPVTLGLALGEATPTPTLVFDETGDYEAVLSITAGAKSAVATCLVHVVASPEPSGNDVTWLGEAATVLMDRREWMWGGNWTGGVAPSNPTPATIRYSDEGMTVTGRLEGDRTVGGVQAGGSGLTVVHALDLAGQTLTVSNQVTLTGAATLNWSNGTVRLGVPGGTAADIVLTGSGLFRLLPGAVLASANLGLVSIAPLGVVDLRGGACAGGVLAMRQLLMPGGSQNSSLFYLNGATALDLIRVTEALRMISGANSGMIYIGDPNDNGRLPSGVSLNIGTAATARAAMTICECSSGYAANAKIVATAGGTFSGWISALEIGTRSGAGTRLPRGTLNLAAMDACDVDITTLVIGPGATSPLPTDDEQGTLRLPPGSCAVGDAVIGATDGVGFGRLTTSNTVVTVTNALAIRATGDVVTRIGAFSSGIDVTHADAGACVLAPGAKLTLQFFAPHADLPHYGFRWQGDHLAELEAWIADGRIVIETAGFGREVSVFKRAGATLIGLRQTGTTLLLR